MTGVLIERRTKFIDPEKLGIEDRRRLIRRQEERERWGAFAEWVYEKRTAKGLTQAQCAKRSGELSQSTKISQTKWNRIEHAQFSMPRELVPGVAAALDEDEVAVYVAAGFEVQQELGEGGAELASALPGAATKEDVRMVMERLDRIEALLERALHVEGV